MCRSARCSGAGPEGSFAPGTDVFFLKLDRSTDQLLAREWFWRMQPIFLDRIDDPVGRVTYLQDLCRCQALWPGQPKGA